MGLYADGYVIPVPKRKLKAYLRLARLGERVWLDHGALEYRECVGEDLDVECGIPFPRLAKIRRGETVVFSWIVYRSRAHRDRVNAKVMKDPRIGGMDFASMPFDFKRMTHGGFSVRVGG